jgi:uncharacterized protein (DUF1800 family)
MTTRDTRALVAHLFRRAGFGLRPDELDHFTSLGVQGSVDYLVNYEQVTNPAETTVPPPDLSQYISPFVPAAQRTTDTLKQIAKLNGEAAQAIQTWWVQRMLATARPLQEKMTVFWHGHFATALSKSPPALMLQQNELFRSMALGNFNALLHAINQDPAMLVWLDGATNRAGKPNENFSRELMELFTIGLGQFTEQDVREGARALTGWTLPVRYRSTAGPITAIFRPRLFDNGTKTYLGHTGDLTAGDVMNILSAHPAAGMFLAQKLFSFFAYDNPPTSVVQPLAATYYATHSDMRAVVRQLLLSDAFYSDQAFQQHFKSPVEFVVGTVRELTAPVPPAAMVRAMTLMGMELFNPPNVGGWPGGLSWANEGTLVERFNFAGALTYLHAPNSTPLAMADLLRQSGAGSVPALIDSLLTRFIGIGATPTTQAALATYLGPDLSPQVLQNRARGLLQLVLSTPEYQLN